ATFRVDNVLSPDDFEIVVSDRADRSGAEPLDGSTIAGDAFVFVTPLPHVTPVSSVEFYVDDPARTGPPVRTDTAAPFDLVGGDAATAIDFDTASLANGQHTVTAHVTTGIGKTTTTATFAVGEPTQQLPPVDESDLVPLTPARLADSRPGNPSVDGDDEA